MIDFSKFGSLIEMLAYFNDEKTCRKAVAESRWGSGRKQDVVCPYCGGHHCVGRRDGRFRCHRCGNNFSCKVGTIFEDSNLPLAKWFVAMYLISSNKKGASSCQLARDIRISQETAWYILQKVRALYAQYDTDTLSGEVECDEVYIGGREKWKHKSMRTAVRLYVPKKIHPKKAKQLPKMKEDALCCASSFILEQIGERLKRPCGVVHWPLLPYSPCFRYFPIVIFLCLPRHPINSRSQDAQRFQNYEHHGGHAVQCNYCRNQGNTH